MTINISRRVDISSPNLTYQEVQQANDESSGFSPNFKIAEHHENQSHSHSIATPTKSPIAPPTHIHLFQEDQMVINVLPDVSVRIL